MKKNQIIRLEISDVTSDGNGVGKFDGMAVFVPETAVGDVINAKVVKVLKNYAYGIVQEIIMPSEDRIASDCPYFPKCGGCSFRHITYESEMKLKEKFVYDAFTRIGKIKADFLPILGCGMPDKYRNKTQYPVSISENGNICGFYAKRSHRIICGTDCRLLPDIFSSIADHIIDYTNANGISGYDEKIGKGLLRHIFIRKGHYSDNIMICLVVTKAATLKFKTLCDELTEKFKNIRSIVMNINPENTNVILGKKTVTLWGNDSISDFMCGNEVDISAESFYQVNTPQAENLYSLAKDFAQLSGNEVLLDLYCGAGTIGLSMADSVKKLIGVEIVAQAIENAKKNAEKNSIENAEFICADAGDAAEQLLQNNINPDVVILDPPRKGCEIKTLDAIIKMNPEKIVMISCNPATAARDCAYLNGNGYEVRKVRAVDMFARTTHVETVVMLSHKKPDSVINVKVEFGEGEVKVPLDNIAKRAAAYKPKERVTYKMIKEYIEAKYGFKVHTTYIAEVKRDLGLRMFDAPNAVEELKQPRKHPTAEKVEAIKDALKHFEVI